MMHWSDVRVGDRWHSSNGNTYKVASIAQPSGHYAMAWLEPTADGNRNGRAQGFEFVLQPGAPMAGFGS